MVILFFDIEYWEERNLISSVLAFPCSGGAVMRIFRVPSLNSPTISLRGDLGIIFTFNISSSMCEIILVYYEII